MQPAFIDTHAHMHFDAFAGEVDAALHRAHEAGVDRIITVGVNTADSRKAVEMASTYENLWAAVGIHPHEAGEIEQGASYLADLAGRRKVIAIGECGFDFYRSETTVAEQEQAVRAQIEIALVHDMPVIFHVREAFDHFFRVVKDYPGLRGVVHSFTGGREEMERSVEAGLHIAINGIVTFTKVEAQKDAARLVPADRLLLETDCPFLSPAPYRGKTNEPSRIADIAAFLSELRSEPIAELAKTTTANAENLFRIVE